MAPLLVKPIETRFVRRLRCAVIAGCGLAVAGMIGTIDMHAQESVGFSLSRQLSTQPRPNLQPALINVGPFRGQMGMGFGVTYDDNADLSSSGAQSEVRFNESLDFDLRWVLTYLNQIRFQLGATLSEVVGGNGNNGINGINGQRNQTLQLQIQPGSNVELRLFAGDFLIRVYDYLAVLQDPTQDPAVTNQSTLNRLTNDSGVSVGWDLNQLTLTARFDYSYSTDLSSGSGSNNDNRSSIRPGLSAAFALSPDMSAGLDFEYSKSFSSGGSQVNVLGTGSSGSNDVSAFTVGPFLRGQLTNAMKVYLAGGLNFVDASNTSPLNYYLLLSLSHQLTRNLQYSATFTHDLEFSTGTDLTENNNFTLSTTYRLARSLSVRTGGFVNFGDVLTGGVTGVAGNVNVVQLPGNFVQYGVNVQVDWALSHKLTASVGYQFIARDADTSGVTQDGATLNGNYKQNRVDLSVHYAF